MDNDTRNFFIGALWAVLPVCVVAVILAAAWLAS